MYSLLKDKGIKEEDIQDLLEIEKDTKSYFQAFLRKYESLVDLLDGQTYRNFVITSLQHEKELTNIITSKGTYPLILFLTVIMAAYFFDTTMIPLISDSILLWSTNNSSLFGFQMGLRFFWMGCLLFSVFMVLYTVRLQNRQFYKRFYTRLCQRFPKNIVVKMHSFTFARFYLALYQSGCNTAQCLKALVDQNASLTIRIIAKEMQKNLEEGKEVDEVLKESLVEKRLKKMFVMGRATGELEPLLERYISVQSQMLVKQFEQTMKGFQTFMYFIAALLIAILYRLLLAPLAVISSI